VQHDLKVIPVRFRTDPACLQLGACSLGGLLLGTVVFGCSGSPRASGSDEPTAIVVDRVGLQAPTAVLHDTVSDVYLVSNVAASTDSTAANGFISRLAPDGMVLVLHWIEGGRGGVELHQPAGMAIRGDTLFIADVECVRLFHLESGRPLGSVCPAGAVALSGMTVAAGVVYVTDRGSATVAEQTGYGIAALDADGGVRRIADPGAVTQPCGIAAGPWGLFVTSTGEQHVSQLTPAGPRPVLRGDGKQLGGIVAARAGSFAFSNWTDSAVHYVEVRRGAARRPGQGAMRVPGRGSVWTLARQLAQPGQLGYDAHRDRILIPEGGRNRVSFINVSGRD
jgi:hypothetical protein